LSQGLSVRDRLVPLGDGKIVVGSSADSGLRIVDPTVSGRHCEVQYERGRVFVRDLGSKNGTWLQGARIVAGELMVGQSLRVGRTSLVLLEGGDGRSASMDEALPGVVGESLLVRSMARKVRLLAQSDLTVLVVGPTGSGKELVARALHALGPRREAPFVPQNCGALPENLVESELFGHERGAFTGALDARAGLFECANGGTLFLDEIGELPLGQQPKLLRVLESRQVRRVGGRSLLPVDVRVVAATHASLPELVAEGRFRRDLYYRLGEALVEVPPLEKRPEDIPLLVAHFLTELGLESRRSSIGAEAVPFERLQARRYPGNVRELRNLVRRASVLGWEQALCCIEEPTGVQLSARAAEERAILAREILGRGGNGQVVPRGYPKMIPRRAGSMSHAAEKSCGYPLSLGELEDHMILEAYQQAGGNRSLAARRLGLAKSTYNDRIRRILGGYSEPPGDGA
jgi:transcriptional regulator with GAF, ATPase, and Fis domain